MEHMIRYANICHAVYFLNPSYYRPQRSWGKAMFLHVSVILFTGGVWPIACWDAPPGTRGRHPPATRGRHPSGSRPPSIPQPPGADPPRTRHPPFTQCMLGEMGKERAVCIPLECNLVRLCKWRKHLKCCKIILLPVPEVKIVKKSIAISASVKSHNAQTKDKRC